MLRIDDLVLYGVSQQSSRREELVKIVSPDNGARATLPQQTPLVHLEMCSYFYQNPLTFAVPKPAMHLVLAPLTTVVDPGSIRWLTYIFENISSCIVRFLCRS